MRTSDLIQHLNATAKKGGFRPILDKSDLFAYGSFHATESLTHSTTHRIMLEGIVDVQLRSKFLSEPAGFAKAEKDACLALIRHLYAPFLGELQAVRSAIQSYDTDAALRMVDELESAIMGKS